MQDIVNILRENIEIKLTETRIIWFRNFDLDFIA